MKGGEESFGFINERLLRYRTTQDMIAHEKAIK
jgi:hypothetical protein